MFNTSNLLPPLNNLLPNNKKAPPDPFFSLTWKSTHPPIFIFYTL